MAHELTIVLTRRDGGKYTMTADADGLSCAASASTAKETLVFIENVLAAFVDRLNGGSGLV